MILKNLQDVIASPFFPDFCFRGTHVKLGTDALGHIKSGCEVLALR